MMMHGPANVKYLQTHLLYSLFRLFRKITKSDYWFRHVSVCPHGTTRLPFCGFSWNSRIFFENMSKKIQISF